MVKNGNIDYISTFWSHQQNMSTPNGGIDTTKVTIAKYKKAVQTNHKSTQITTFRVLPSHMTYLLPSVSNIHSQHYSGQSAQVT